MRAYLNTEDDLWMPLLGFSSSSRRVESTYNGYWLVDGLIEINYTV